MTPILAKRLAPPAGAVADEGHVLAADARRARERREVADAAGDRRGRIGDPLRRRDDADSREDALCPVRPIANERHVFPAEARRRWGSR